MSSSTVSRVLIVGAGITGQLLSICLARKGVDVILVERRRELGATGHGITIQGNALKAFREAGVLESVMEKGVPFSHMRLLNADGSLIVELQTPHTGGDDLPSTFGALRSDVSSSFAQEIATLDVDVRTGMTVSSYEDRGDDVVVTLSDGTTETVDLLVAADGIRSQTRAMIGITDEPRPVGMGIWRVVAKRPPQMDCAEVYYNGPKFKAGYSPISDDLCYAYLLEENLDPSFVGEKPNGKVLKEHGEGYEGTWGEIRDSLADDEIVNYQWIETICVSDPWYRGRAIVVGDAAHACPPLIAQGAAMCSEDAVVLAEMLTSGEPLERVLEGFMARRFPRVEMVLDNSLQLAEWEIHPGQDPNENPGKLMNDTLCALQQPA